MKDKLDFLPADKHKRFFQIDAIILGNLWPGMPKLPNITSWLFLCIILRWKQVMKLTFCILISTKVSYILILWFLMGMVKHSQMFQNSKFAMSLQYDKVQDQGHRIVAKNQKYIIF